MILMGPKYNGKMLGHLERYYSESIFNSVKEICEYELIYYCNINNNNYDIEIVWAVVMGLFPGGCFFFHPGRGYDICVSLR